MDVLPGFNAINKNRENLLHLMNSNMMKSSSCGPICPRVFLQGLPPMRQAPFRLEELPDSVRLINYALFPYASMASAPL